MKNKTLLLLIAITLLFTGQIKAQTQTVNHSVPFSSGMQNMWGPSWSAFSINMDIEIFEQSWNESFNTGNSGIISILGQQFGAAVSGGISGTIGSRFSLTGFTTGEVQVDYPIDVEVKMSDDFTYDQGDDVLIETSYAVENGWTLDTYYPNAGEAKLDLYIELGASLSATLCAFGCTTFPVIPNFNTGTININLFTVNSSGIDILSTTVFGNTIGPMYHYNGFPLTTSDIPNDPLGDYGFTATLGLPDVHTTDYLNSPNISACGNSTYLELELEIFQLLSNFFTGPLEPVGQVLENLSGSEDLLGGLATINWNFLSASFNMDLVNNQCFDFKPKVYGKFVFPVAVDYTILNPVGGTVSSGTSSIINMEIGNDLRYKFPCYYEKLNITPTYSINGKFTNHTYDSISFSFQMSALEFSLVIPPLEITPAIHVPQICLPYAYPCPTWSKPWKWCTGSACTPAFTIPAVGYSGMTFGIGPLWELVLPIADIKYDWYNNTWDLAGFSTYTKPAFTMKASILSVAHSQTNVNCYGGTNGAINITTSAVSPTAYTYLWTNGQTSQNLTNLPAGPYEVQISDAHGCQLFTGATILEPEQPLDVTYSKIDKSCNGGPNNGSIDILIQGGTAPYTQLWSTGANLEDISGLAAGVYSVTVTDAKLCTYLLSVTIDEPGALGQVGVVSNVNCRGNADGSINVEAFGGTLPYSYSWLSGQITEDISGVIAGGYTLTVTDAKNCTNLALYTITQPAQDLTLSSTQVNVLCKYDATGSIDITTVGGTPGYVYAWVNSQGIVLPIQSEDISNIVADIYTVNVTDSKGCRAQLVSTITEPIQRLESNPVSQNISCFGDPTGQIDPVISGGTAPYTYNWSNGSSAPILAGVVAGAYSLTLTDNNGCSRVFNYTLTEPAEALALTLTGTNILCFGESTGAISSLVTGGTLNYSYMWNTGSVSTTLSGLISGSYNLTVTDSKGCLISDNIVLIQPAAPLTLSSTVVNVDCFGNNSGSIDLTAAGGTTPYRYYWSNGGSIVMNDTIQDISNLYSDNFNVLVTDAHGCQESLNSIISQPSAPLSMSGVVNDVNCFGLNDGAIDVTVAGGTAVVDYSYSWSNTSNTEDIVNEVAGTYTLNISDDNGCTLTQDYTILQPLAPLTATLAPVDVKCNGGTDGRITSVVTGGTTPYVYNWSTAETTNEIFNLSAGAYSLTVTDAQGCVSFTGTVINEPAQALLVMPIVSDVQCYGNSDGVIQLNISGGVTPYYFNWGNQNEILINNFSETIASLNEGEYFIRVTDRNGCINEQLIIVNQPQPIELSYVLSPVLCFGDNTGSADLTINGGTPNYSTTWSNGQTTEDATGLAGGIHTVNVIDNQGCKVTDTIVIDQPNLLEVAYEIIDLSCVDQADAAIHVSAYGGVNPMLYNWSNGSNVQNIENLGPGLYELMVTDGNSCQLIRTFEITENNSDCVFIPNTFTPNGDLYNDTWEIRNIELYPNASVKVFNKWGNNIFDSKGIYDPWDGTHNGNPLPAEVYYYIILLENSEGNEYTGTITIIR